MSKIAIIPNASEDEDVERLDQSYIGDENVKRYSHSGK